MGSYLISHNYIGLISLIDGPDSEDPSLLEEDLLAVLKVSIQLHLSIHVLTR